MFKERLQFYSKIPKNKHIVQIEGLEVEHGKQVCIQLKSLRVFCKFYNHTIKDAIEIRNKKYKDRIQNNLDNYEQYLIQKSCPQKVKNNLKSNLQESQVRSVVFQKQSLAKYPVLANIDSVITRIDSSSEKNTSTNNSGRHSQIFSPTLKPKEDPKPNFGIMTGYTEPDVWYLICSLISVAEVYQKTYSREFNEFKMEKVYLSTEGYIKVYLSQTCQSI